MECKIEYCRPEWLSRYQDFKSLCSDGSGEYIRFYLNTGCEQIRYTHSRNTDGLPNYSCRLTAEDGSVLLLEFDDWVTGTGSISGSWSDQKSAEVGLSKRLRPGPGSAGAYAPWASVSSRDVPPEVSAKEIQGVIDYVNDLGPVGEVELHRAIGARRWGPGRFRAAVREAIRQGHIRRNRRGRLETTDR